MFRMLFGKVYEKKAVDSTIDKSVKSVSEQLSKVAITTDKTKKSTNEEAKINIEKEKLETTTPNKVNELTTEETKIISNHIVEEKKLIAAHESSQISARIRMGTAVNDDVCLNIEVTEDTRNFCKENYNNFTIQRYKEMIRRRACLGHTNAWNRIGSSILYACGGILAFIAGTLHLWILSIVSGAITILGGAVDLIGMEILDKRKKLDNDLKSLKIYVAESNNSNNPPHELVNGSFAPQQHIDEVMTDSVRPQLFDSQRNFYGDHRSSNSLHIHSVSIARSYTPIYHTTSYPITPPTSYSGTPIYTTQYIRPNI